MTASTHPASRLVASAIALFVIAVVARGFARHDARAPLLGTRHPIWIAAIGPDHRWVVACQARHDTDGDGRIAVHRRDDGGWTGDALQPYLFLRGIGDGIAIADRPDLCRGARDGLYVGIDDHRRVLRETEPRPDPSALAWGPLRWDDR